MTYHWILTVQYTDGRVRSVSGELPATFPERTRTAALANISRQVKKAFGKHPDEEEAILFFSLEPNEL